MCGPSSLWSNVISSKGFCQTEGERAKSGNKKESVDRGTASIIRELASLRNRSFFFLFKVFTSVSLPAQRNIGCQDWPRSSLKISTNKLQINLWSCPNQYFQINNASDNNMQKVSSKGENLCRLLSMLQCAQTPRKLLNNHCRNGALIGNECRNWWRPKLSLIENKFWTGCPEKWIQISVTVHQQWIFTHFTFTLPNG